MSVATTSLLAFAASQVGTPGPANMAMMAAGAGYGFRRAMPFMFGVALGKQIIIWPIGFGLMELAQGAPMLFQALKWASVAYICWLAWKIANLRFSPEKSEGQAPGFIHGLAVHPLNPKAWAMIIAAFTNFVSEGTGTLQATFTIAICLLGVQLLLHPLWTLAGEGIANTLAGSPAERFLMLFLASLTVLSVFYVLFWGV